MKTIFILLLFVLINHVAGAQNIGVGTANPTRAKLEVHGVAGNGNTSAVFGSDAAGISFQRNWPTIGFNQYRDNATGYGKYMSYGYAAVQYFDPATGSMYFDMLSGGSGDFPVAESKRVLSFNRAGNVTIGHATGNFTLTVSRGNSVDATAYFFGTTHHSSFDQGTAGNTYIRAGKDNGTVFLNDIPGGRVVLNGFVGINTATPDYPLEIRQPASGRGFVIVEPTYFSNWEYNINSANGNLQLNNNSGVGKGYYKGSDGSYNTYSDGRLKTNVESLPSLMDKFMQLQPVKYEMIHDNPEHKQSIGFIAQDVNKLFPELVSVSTDTAHSTPGITNLHMLSYDGFSILAIKMIQEQQVLIQKQKTAIDAIRFKMTVLKDMIDSMKQ
ncbi:MAG TPA: tail fiber domain-containing protein [Chitinophagaceae bacterium]|nr:tail fiber domain-containing protein [Chitinophagaceae bacterium]